MHTYTHIAYKTHTKLLGCTRINEDISINIHMYCNNIHILLFIHAPVSNLNMRFFRTDVAPPSDLRTVNTKTQ